jgi:hypothetical protein
VAKGFVKQTIDIAKGGSLVRINAVLSALVQHQPVRVTLDQVRNSRSYHQNNALWMAYAILGEHTGYESQDLHEEMCKRVFGVVHREVLGKQVEKAARTTTTDENGKKDLLPWDKFCDFYRSVQLLGDSLGCYIPDPDPMKRTR